MYIRDHTLQRLIFWMAVLMSFISINTASGQPHDNGLIYTVAIDREYFPYEFEDDAGRISGFTPALLAEIGKAAGVTFQFKPLYWPDAVKGLENGSVDIINMIRAPNRINMYEFSEPHSQVKQAIFRKRLSKNITDLKSLSGHEIALQYNDISAEMLKDNTDFNKHFVHSKAEGFMRLNSGKVAAFLAAEKAGLLLIREYNLTDIEPAALGLFPREFCFVARKGNKALIALLNSHLQQLKASGRYDELANKWLLGFSQTIEKAKLPWKKIIVVISFLLVTVILFFAWNIVLRRKVSQKTEALQKAHDELERRVYERTIELTNTNEQLTQEQKNVVKYLETQTVLLREVNHRVKNNLSAIIGMLYIEQDRAKAKGKADYSDALNNLIGRIEGLSTVHSLLSASGWQPLLLTELCDQLISSVLVSASPGKTISFDIDSSKVRVNSNQAHNLALVINELAMNTLKHALAESESTKIRVRIEKKEDLISIIFKDDGPGFPQNIITKGEKAANVGLELIFGIVKKNLRGEVMLG
ncbi:MAG: transporter substrate-binding domain-containing protein, partial [Desulfobacterales bacterium]|nr:transporter substrate-binding domain-containing protein [Desulfobacterales bacterium]